MRGSARLDRLLLLVKKFDFPVWENIYLFQVRYLAKLLRCSQRTLLYTGAGSSTSAGVSQTARGKKLGAGRTTTQAEPTSVHRALVLLTR